MANRLAAETSPYLQQHQANPVDWYPWGEEAFERAKREDKPIFLSVGYSSCHWCHVMAHESFEDDDTAALMNQHFINIKVDREERPDVDGIYMQAVQALSGHGGWPMSVWLLPDGRPFYGGTYFPDKPRQGMPSFSQVLTRIAEIFVEKRDRIENDASRLTSAISGRILLENENNQPLSASVLENAYQHIAKRYDEQWGGFGTQPKFPPSMTLELLLRLNHKHEWQHALTMVTHTLDHMMNGGLYDQLGGGFHRYSVDRLWLVPHFEKMLYDNALLIRIYLHAYQVTGDKRYRRVVEETVDYIRREMTSAEGGFYSSQDADSEGVEGKFFVWSQDEIREVLKHDVNVDAVLDYWGVTNKPNFEGEFILWVPESPEEVAMRHEITAEELLDDLQIARKLLFEIREQRVKPGCDDKILAAWSGLMINSLAQVGRVLGRDDITDMAVRAASFIIENMQQENGRLCRAFKDGRTMRHAFLEDYGFMIEGLVELYQTTFDLRWFEKAIQLSKLMVDLFWDDESGFYDTAHDHESLITRPQEVTDNAIPSGTSGAVAGLVRMAALTGNTEWNDRAERVLSRLSVAVQQHPSAFSYLASQLDFVLSVPHEVAIVGEEDTSELNVLLDIVRKPYRPNQVVAMCNPEDANSGYPVPLLRNRSTQNGKPTAYVCQNFVCRLPVSTPEGLRKQLSSATA